MISEKNFDISLNPSNTFTSDVPIKGKAYCRVFIDLVGEGSWQIVPDNTYDIINDVIVFPIQPIGKFVSLQISTTPAELTQSPTENSMILTIKNEIKSVSDNMENLINIASKVDALVPSIVKIGNVADNILSVNNVSTNMTKVSNVDANMLDVDNVSTNILSVNNVSDNMTKVSNVDANMSDVDIVSTNILSVNNVSDNMTKVSNVDANMTKVSNVDANMLDINNAEENAQLAIQYKNLAQKWASELEDVVVADGKYSAYHWALKAYLLVTEGVINDITASTTTTYSSNKLEELLALKANLLNPKFIENISIGNIVLSPWASSYSVVEGKDSSFYGNDGVNTIIGNNCYFNGTNWIYKNNGKATLQILSMDNHTFKTTSSGSAGEVITWNTVATLGNDSVIVPYIQNQINTIRNRLDTHIPLSGIASYHLLQGNLSATINANYVEVSATTTRNYTTLDYIFDSLNNKLYDCILASTSGVLLTNTTYFTSITAGTLSINNAIIPLAHGVDSNGSKNSIVIANETITGLTYTAGKNYLYKTDTGYGIKPYEPRYLSSELVRKFAGEQPDYYDVESNKWFNTDAGSELVSNGKFDVNTTGWTAQNGSTISVVNGTLNIVRGTGNYSVLQVVTGLIIGKKYKFTIGTVSNIILFVSNTTNTYNYATISSSNTSVKFIATETSLWIQGHVSSGTGNIDNVSIFDYVITPTTEITESRNFLNHIVHADQNGQITYVEEIPKIEYKDIIKANEFIGKNACTAWCHYDLSTTPPTLKEGYNIGTIIRVATGSAELYFNEAMDTDTYVALTDIKALYGIGDQSNVGIQYKNRVIINSTAFDNSALNATSVYIAIFGGKN